VVVLVQVVQVVFMVMMVELDILFPLLVQVEVVEEQVQQEELLTLLEEKHMEVTLVTV
tara:strand:- start:235 stop:408 length:174 start_codon:yes stop_codon:yes gene_type:complete